MNLSCVPFTGKESSRPEAEKNAVRNRITRSHPSRFGCRDFQSRMTSLLPNRFGTKSPPRTNPRLKAVHNTAQGRATKERHPGDTNHDGPAVRGSISENVGCEFRTERKNKRDMLWIMFENYVVIIR